MSPGHPVGGWVEGPARCSTGAGIHRVCSLFALRERMIVCTIMATKRVHEIAMLRVTTLKCAVRHSFNDYNHCDLTAMVGSVSSNENRGEVTAPYLAD